jgi:hypothetical protein
MGHDISVTKGRAGSALPGNWFAFEELREQLGLLLEEGLVVVEVVTEEREGLDAGASSKDYFGSPS